MKRITGTCALLLLLSACGGNTGGGVGGETGDSSPIIIADGSVHLKQRDHFRIHGTRRASVKLCKHTPSAVGYMCNPDQGGSCSAGDCNPTVKANCVIKLKGLSEWHLDIYDDTPAKVATLSWDTNSDPEKVAIDALLNDFIPGTTGDFAELVVSPKNLTSAVFNGGGSTITLTCPSGQVCVKVGYYCSSGCPGKP